MISEGHIIGLTNHLKYYKRARPRNSLNHLCPHSTDQAESHGLAQCSETGKYTPYMCPGIGTKIDALSVQQLKIKELVTS